jgi:hypothetical protein
MVGNAVFGASVVLLAVALFLAQECRFLIPYRHVLFGHYGRVLAEWAGILFINVFAAIYLAARLVFLKDTGRKLAHLEKQLRMEGDLADDLSRRLEDENR